jgi:hypothetical protein
MSWVNIKREIPKNSEIALHQSQEGQVVLEEKDE